MLRFFLSNAKIPQAVFFQFDGVAKQVCLAQTSSMAASTTAATSSSSLAKTLRPSHRRLARCSDQEHGTQSEAKHHHDQRRNHAR